MITVFLEDVWEEIITEKGKRLLAEEEIKLEGNIFGKHPKKLTDLKQVDLIVATDSNLKLLNWAKIHKVPVIYYALFPDLILGWDYQANRYKNYLTSNFKTRIVKVQQILVNSTYTKSLLKGQLPQHIDLKICRLGIDFKSISCRTANLTTTPKRLKVLWNHMWRKDKGFIDAISIILDLAEKFPQTDFIVGRKEDWSGSALKELKKIYHRFLAQIKEKDIQNISFLEIIPPQEDYWSFLKSVDISFSCARHETFGLSMLEQEAAGIACVVPDAEVYPEIHSGAMLLPYDKIESGLVKLIEDKRLRNQLSRQCKKNASKYDIDKFVINFSQHIKEVVKSTL